jgi:hypothetical protein
MTGPGTAALARVYTLLDRRIAQRQRRQKGPPMPATIVRIIHPRPADPVTLSRQQLQTGRLTVPNGQTQEIADLRATIATMQKTLDTLAAEIGALRQQLDTTLAHPGATVQEQILRALAGTEGLTMTALMPCVRGTAGGIEWGLRELVRRGQVQRRKHARGYVYTLP